MEYTGKKYGSKYKTDPLEIQPRLEYGYNEVLYLKKNKPQVYEADEEYLKKYKRYRSEKEALEAAIKLTKEGRFCHIFVNVVKDEEIYSFEYDNFLVLPDGKKREDAWAWVKAEHHNFEILYKDWTIYDIMRQHIDLDEVINS